METKNLGFPLPFSESPLEYGTIHLTEKKCEKYI